MKARLLTAARDLTIGLALSLAAMICSGLLILNAGRIAAVFGADQKIVSVLSQLHHAKIISPWRLLISGAIVLSIGLDYPRYAKRRAVRIILTAFNVVLWLSYFVLMLLGASVNSVPVHTALKILINLIRGGALNAL